MGRGQRLKIGSRTDNELCLQEYSLEWLGFTTLRLLTTADSLVGGSAPEQRNMTNVVAVQEFEM